MNKRFRSGWMGLFALSTSMLSACSLSLFSDKKDPAPASYRQVNPECSGIKVSEQGLDTPTFLRLVDCFNNDGGLKEISDLAHKLSPEELDPFVQFFNKYILYDARTLAEIDRSFQDMSEDKSVDAVLLQLGKLLENEDFLYSTIGLLKELYFKHSGFLVRPTVDTELLKALEHFSAKITPEGFVKNVDAGLALAESHAFSSLQMKLRGPSPSGRSLSETIDQIQTYLNHPEEQGAIPIGRRVVEKLASGELLNALDPALGNTKEQLRRGIPRTAAFFDVSLADNGRMLVGLNALLRALDGPIHCMKGSQSVPNGVNFILNELYRLDTSQASTFIGRDNQLLLTGVNPFCEYPTELTDHLPELLELAATSALEPTVDAIKGFRDAKMTRFLIELHEDPTLPLIIPPFAELRDRGALVDVFLVATLLRVEDRRSFYETLRYLLEPVPSLGGKSLYDLGVQALARASSSTLYDFASSIGKYIESDEQTLAPALWTMRTAYYSDSAHPYVGLVRKVLAEAPKNQAIFTSLFSIYNRQDFKDAVKLVAKIAKNGRLKEILASSIGLFKPFAETGEAQIVKGVAEPYVARRAHDLSSSELEEFTVSRVALPAACRNLDVAFSMAEPSRAGYDAQLSSYLACLNNNGLHAPIVKAVDFYRGTQTEDGRNYWAWTIDLTKGYLKGLSSAQASFLSDAYLRTYDDKRFSRALDAIPFLSVYPVQGGPVLRPLLDLPAPLMADEPRKSLVRLEKFGAKVLRREDLPELYEYTDRLLDKRLEPSASRESTEYPENRIRELLKTTECVADPWAQNLRIDGIKQDYRNTVNSWELVDGYPRYSWGKDEFKERVNGPILDRLVDPRQSDPKKLALDALFTLPRYFTLEDDQPTQDRHYRPEYLLKWLHEMSNDVQAIPYFYPGESAPRVRLVNSLDRLDLVLLNSDYEAPIVKKNFALQFLAEVADSWGDEPESLWPPEIREKARRAGKRPPTLAETVDAIYDTLRKFDEVVGDPQLPKCEQISFDLLETPPMKEVEKRFYNAKQVMSVLKERLPRECSTEEKDRGECTKNANGKWEKAGLKVLRNLFFQIHYSTPPQNRIDDRFAGDPFTCLFQPKKGACAGEANNLNLILRFVRMGILRQVGRQLKYFESRDPSLGDFFRGFVQSASAGKIGEVVSTLLKTDSERKLLWNSFFTIFDIINASEGRELTDFYKKQLEGKTEEVQKKIRAEWVMEFQRLKQLGYYGLALVGENKLGETAVNNVDAILDRYREYLTTKSDKLRNVLRSARVSYFVRGFYEDGEKASKGKVVEILRDAMSDPTRALDLIALVKVIDEDAKAREAIDRFMDRLDALGGVAEYQSLNIGEIRAQLRDFLLERSSSSAGVQLARDLRLYLADRLESGDIDQLLLLAAHKPDEAYQLLEALSHEISTRQLHDFTELLRRGLTEQSWDFR